MATPAFLWQENPKATLFFLWYLLLKKIQLVQWNVSLWKRAADHQAKFMIWKHYMKVSWTWRWSRWTYYTWIWSTLDPLDNSFFFSRISQGLNSLTLFHSLAHRLTEIEEKAAKILLHSSLLIWGFSATCSQHHRNTCYLLSWIHVSQPRRTNQPFLFCLHSNNQNIKNMI